MMKEGTSSSFNILLILLLVILFGLLGFSLFKNIAYPLIWGDEGETVMFGQQVLTYGYPKVHGEKNVVYTLARGEMELGIKEEKDLFIAVAPGQYYFATLGLRWADSVADIYAKTARLRLPFAVMGLAGVVILGITLAGFFQNLRQKLLFLNFFVFLELFSVPLVLHLREARYYSLVVFLVASILYVYLRHRYLGQFPRLVYVVLMIFILLLLLPVFFPAFTIAIAAIGLNELREYIKRINIKRGNRAWLPTALKSKRTLLKLISTILPLLLALVLAVPYFVYFETFRMSREISGESLLDIDMYFEHLRVAWDFFRENDFIYLLLLMKGFLFWLWPNTKKSLIDKKTRQRKQVSNALTLFFIVYILLIARILYLFQRYFIALQPIMVGIILIDASVVIQLIGRIDDRGDRKITRLAFSGLTVLAFVLSARTMIKPIRGHLYEMTHQFRGVLDYAIPYIKENYTNPAELVIATNYEETPYMYYLGSRVTIGYGGNNLEEDLKIRPDIIIIRKSWVGAENTPSPEVFDQLLGMAKYNKVAFPVLDFFVNNIAELGSHVFRTTMAPSEQWQLEIFVREEENGKTD